MTELSTTISRRSTHDRCVSCGSHEILPNNGFVVCVKCGTCQEPVLEPGAFQLYARSEFDGYQFTQSMALGKRVDLMNSIGSQVGRRFNMLTTSKFLRLRRIHCETNSRMDERLSKALSRLHYAAGLLQIPDQTKERAAYFLRKTVPHFPAKTNLVPLVIVVLILAIRFHHLPITERDILKVIPYSYRSKTALNQMKFSVMRMLGIQWPLSRPEIFIPRYISTLRTNEKILKRLSKKKVDYDYFSWMERTARLVLSGLKCDSYGGRFPDTLAASLLYAIDAKILRTMTQKTLADALGIGEYSVRDHYNQFWKKRIQQLIEQAGGENQ